MPATTRAEASRNAPGSVLHDGSVASIELTRSPRTASAADTAAAILTSAGFNVSHHPDEAVVVWRKMAVPARLALATTAVLGELGKVRTERPGLLEALVVDVCTIASANGHEEADPTTVGQALVSLRATTKSSLLRDVEALTRLARRASKLPH